MSEIEELRAKLEESNQLKQECGRSLKGLLEWAEKADVALEKCVKALEMEVSSADETSLIFQIQNKHAARDKAIAIARPLLKTRPEMN